MLHTQWFGACSYEWKCAGHSDHGAHNICDIIINSVSIGEVSPFKSNSVH